MTRPTPALVTSDWLIHKASLRSLSVNVNSVACGASDEWRLVHTYNLLLI